MFVGTSKVHYATSSKTFPPLANLGQDQRPTHLGIAGDGISTWSSPQSNAMLFPAKYVPPVLFPRQYWAAASGGAVKVVL